MYCSTTDSKIFVCSIHVLLKFFWHTIVVGNGNKSKSSLKDNKFCTSYILLKRICQFTCSCIINWDQEFFWYVNMSQNINIITRKKQLRNFEIHSIWHFFLTGRKTSLDTSNFVAWAWVILVDRIRSKTLRHFITLYTYLDVFYMYIMCNNRVFVIWCCKKYHHRLG